MFQHQQNRRTRPHMSVKQDNSIRTIRVFIASPGDLAVERRAFKEVIDELNSGFGDGARVRFESLGWEDTLATTGRRSQGIINIEIDRCDVFVLAMHRRWGQEAPDAIPYSSYTEEEFHRAYDRWKKPKRRKERAPEIFVFFKHIDPTSMADAGPQLEKVLAFRRQLEESREVLYRGFADETEFRYEIDRHLRAFSKGELPKADADRDKVLLPLGVLEEIQKEKAETEKALRLAEEEHQVAQAAVARAEGLALGLAERAAKAALDGRVEEARQDFAKAADGTANFQVLYLAFEFYWRTGDLAAAEETIERRLAMIGPDSDTTDTASTFGNLGVIHKTRGDLDKAEEMHNKALAIDETLGNKEGIAKHYGNLGLVYRNRGDLDKAEGMSNKALAIDEKLGREEGMAKQYGNLGNIHRTRGDLDKAEEMCNRALSINARLGNQVGLASNYGNLGMSLKARGKLDEAEEMYKKALAINEKLGRQGGLAKQYGNLGTVYQTRGEQAMAAEMYSKSLSINEKLGNQEGMATYYDKLGILAEERGDLKTARDFWTKSRDIYRKIGIPDMGWLDTLPPDE